MGQAGRQAMGAASALHRQLPVASCPSHARTRGNEPAENLLNQRAPAARQAGDKDGPQACFLRSCAAPLLLLLRRRQTAAQHARQAPQQALARSTQSGGKAGRRLRLPLLLLLRLPLLPLLLGVTWRSIPWMPCLPLPLCSPTILPLFHPIFLPILI